MEHPRLNRFETVSIYEHQTVPTSCLSTASREHGHFLPSEDSCSYSSDTMWPQRGNSSTLAFFLPRSKILILGSGQVANNCNHVRKLISVSPFGSRAEAEHFKSYWTFWTLFTEQLQFNYLASCQNTDTLRRHLDLTRYYQANQSIKLLTVTELSIMLSQWSLKAPSTTQLRTYTTKESLSATFAHQNHTGAELVGLISCRWAAVMPDNRWFCTRGEVLNNTAAAAAYQEHPCRSATWGKACSCSNGSCGGDNVS